ncbi:MAG: TolC family protein [Planctomycetales bacterium]|nr:TolC family protein [Planctomycetales bacterium]
MSRSIFRWAAIAQICLVLFTGCHPTQPFFVPRDDAMSHYIDQALSIEYADVYVDSLPEATMAVVPFGPDHVPEQFVDLTLEDCVAYALQNSKILRTTNGSNQLSSTVAAALLSAQPGQMPSTYDPALMFTTANTQPLAIDNQGNRIAPRGAFRANQVGGVEDALSEFDAQSSMILGYNTTDRPRNVGQGNIFNPQFYQAFDGNAQAALSKRMATGSIATARFTTIYSRNNIPASGNALGSTNFGRSVPSDYTAAVELQWIQPLLRGRGTLVNRIPIVLAQINQEQSTHDFEANVINLVKSVEDAYWDLYLGYRAFETAKLARDRAKELVDVAQERADRTATPKHVVYEARAVYQQFQSQVNSALNGGANIPGIDPSGLYGREQILREKMGWSPTDGTLIRPADEPTQARVQFDWNEVRGEGLTRNVFLRKHKWSIKAREMELISAKNQILPQLDLSLTYRWLGVGDTFAAAQRSGINFPDPGSNALEELTGGRYQELGARLELTPQAIGKRKALQNITNAQIALAKFTEELREKENMLVFELSTAFRNMDSSLSMIKSFADQWQERTSEIEVLEKNLSIAPDMATLMDQLLRAEQSRAQVELQYYQALAAYNKSLVYIHYLKGSLLDLNSISLGEGAWVDKAYWDAEERARERASGLYFDYGYTRPGVMSRGPVEYGGLTEGNISDPYSESTQPDVEAVEPSEGPAGQIPEREQPKLEPLPERQPRTAPITQDRSGRTRNATAGAFEWGNLNIDESNTSVAHVVPNNAAANRVVVVSSSANQSNTNASRASISDTQAVWRGR